ncbi:signal peptidase II [Pseudonocardia sp. T1-2H]|uniref:signal peptidase II n=1 Tax=Pseudonocardia sp. T1-2H TaxID=3128899 RepID=UPI0031010ADA
MSRRGALVAMVAAFAAVSWGIKEAVEASLAGGRVVDLGIVQLRLLRNSGISFSMGAGLPAWVILAVTGLITLVVAVFGWRGAPTLPVLGLVGVSGILAGALTNLADRAIDGAVTDYLHTGWFATFNVPDSLITLGVVALAIAFLLQPDTPAETKD